MNASAPKTIYRQDYLPPAYLIDEVRLRFVIGQKVEIKADLDVRPNPAAISGQPLLLNGEGLETQSVRLDNQDIAYAIDNDQMVIQDVPNRPFRLTTTVLIDPAANKALSGLYVSGEMLCTQCEAEGFRRITWFMDRPDVMSRYTVEIIAPKDKYPVLLSNGNLIDQVALERGRHRVVWEDPFPKPSYLFALVAGDLALVEGSFETRSGRDVALKFWVEHGNETQVDHALVSLQKSMKWDEEVYGLEYDLDVFNVVAVSHFNMGAMENKSLNVFNSKYVLARRDTATDQDFLGIESVIAHEYFHNWTGNRVTCRDWFQLTLKEGLTVFRDQEFSSDMNSRALKRIEDVNILRAGQFPEDNGPMAHPIRPDSYQEINNFYTATVYQKGAEVIRMIHTLIGAKAFRAGMDLYFKRHDGQAVTCEDFIRAMEDASDVDLTQFRRWYEQAGTPRISAGWSWDERSFRFKLKLSQSCPPSPGQTEKKPFHIPVRIGLVGLSGDHPLKLAGHPGPATTNLVLNLTEESQVFEFEDIPEAVVPSLLRGFSAPVVLEAPYSSEDLAFLMGMDSDPFCRWNAGQELASRVLLDQVALIQSGQQPELDEGFAKAWGMILEDAPKDEAFAAEALMLPALSVLGEKMQIIDPDALFLAQRFTNKELARRYQAKLFKLHSDLADEGYELDPKSMGRRRLRNMILYRLAMAGLEDAKKIALNQFKTATNMTDQLAGLNAIMEFGADAAASSLDAFFQQWQGEKLVVNKWLSAQAMACWFDVTARVKALTEHQAFDYFEPNKIYALIGGFAANQRAFHNLDGSGYEFMADQVIKLDPDNPQVASRLVRSLMRWKRYDVIRQQLMCDQLRRIQSQPGLSPDVAEIVGKALQ